MTYFGLLPSGIMWIIMIITYFFFLRTLRDLLWAVSEQNRKMVPAAVWLNWIPVFSWGWMFVTIVKVRESAQAEIAWKGLRANSNLGFGVGMTSGVLFVLGEIVLPIALWGQSIPRVGMAIVYYTTYGAMFVCMLVYWMRVSELQGILAGAVPVPGSPASPTETISYQARAWHQAPEPEPPVPAGPPLGAEAVVAAGAATMPVAATPPQTAPAPMPVTQAAAQPQPPAQPHVPPQAQAPPATMPVVQPSQYRVPQAGEAPIAAPAASAPISPEQPPVVPPAICPSCGTADHHVGGFCRSCGRSVTVVWPTGEVPAADESADQGAAEGAAALSRGICSFCGAPYKPGGKFCSSCGRPAG